MDYEKIRSTIIGECTTMLSLVSPDIHDYTHQPSEEYIIRTIECSIKELEQLINNIKEE